MSVEIKYGILDSHPPLNFQWFYNYCMDQELFKQRLSEVAEWRQPKITKSDLKEAQQRARGRGRRSAEQRYQEEHEEVFTQMFDGVNPTVPLELQAVKPVQSHCEHCDQMVQGGPHIEKKLVLSGPRKHWRERCLTCGLCKDPYTGQFALTGTEASIKWNSYLRNPKRSDAHQKNVTNTDDNCVITFYGRSTEKNK